ncbi:MAG TPA: hypothetical protein G4N94_05225 [Caldilineae bacterium]|nr:hypothetical protein [Caldilineae bacterium]
MDTTQLAQMVTWLDEQHRRDRTEITKLQQRIEAQTNEAQEQARRIQELEARLTSAQTQLGRFDQIEQALQNLKNEITLMVNAQGDEVAKMQREIERSRMTDRESFSRSITEIRKELPRLRAIEEDLAVRKAEDQRMSEMLISLRQELSEIDKDFDERTRGLPYLIEQRDHNNKRIAQLQQENVELFKRVEGMGSKQQLLDHKQQKMESQVSALPAIVDDMKRGQEQFVESLKLADADRQRQMRDWQQTFDEQQTAMEEHSNRLKVFAAVYEETKRTLANMEKFQQRLQQEQNQVAELQRLAEQRQKKELETFAADNEKRWKKQILEWQFRWDQQDKLNAQINDRFPQVADQLDYHEELLQFLWRLAEAQSSAQLTAAQNWLGEVQKLANQRERITKEYEERAFHQA